MVFSSTIFLYVFLPSALLLYYLAAYHFRNAVLLIASLVFYAWGEPVYVLLMLCSIALNWLVGIAMEQAENRHLELLLLSAGVSVNLFILSWFKYANFIASIVNQLTSSLLDITISIDKVVLPAGISFYTFHAISYLVDISRRQASALRNPLDMALYISMFPQLIAGPIIRYHDVADQLTNRSNSAARFASGVERFVFGLGKKVLIANTLGQVADQAFSSPISNLSMSSAWIGVVCYTLQIYFDFSGYSDMAIGLGRMFGFELTENFNYPYIARSLREFWRRWHLSLSTWFRDYLYIPLGGNRVSTLRVSLNLFLVFSLCGLWHGASWSFVFWGLFHGSFLVLERGPFGSAITKVPPIIASGYTLLVVMIGWVFFRADNFSHALHYLAAMFRYTSTSDATESIHTLLNTKTYVLIIIGAILSTPICAFFARDWKNRRFPAHAAESIPLFFSLARMVYGETGVLIFARSSLCLLILVSCMAGVAADTYNPFLYFRF